MMTQFISIDKNIYLSCSIGSKVQIFGNRNTSIIWSIFDNILESLTQNDTRFARSFIMLTFENMR